MHGSNFIRTVIVLATITLPLHAQAAGPKATTPPPSDQSALHNPKVHDLGNGHFRVGLIKVDRNQRRFTIPAVVHKKQGMQEFILCTKGGFKEYESTLEAGATAYEVNVACLLIGLDPKHARTPRFHFDPNKITGDRVAISVNWEEGKQKHHIDASQAVKDNRSGKTLPDAEWVYTGSTFTDDGAYLAQTDGVLIGFVHDPAEIITHVTGMGQGDYGSLVPNTEKLPAMGTRVTVEVKALASTPPKAK